MITTWRNTMSNDKIYPGTSAFFANREGNHNYLANTSRPFLSVSKTSKKGKKTYNDLFINKDVAVTISKDKKTITLKFPADINKPLFSVLDKD
jgi:hypothetical protein